MATPEFLKLGARPASPVLTTAWFEFLLKPELLIKHLNDPHATPGPTQLIIQFLQQASAVETAAEQKKTELGEEANGLPKTDESTG